MIIQIVATVDLDGNICESVATAFVRFQQLTVGNPVVFDDSNNQLNVAHSKEDIQIARNVEEAIKIAEDSGAKKLSVIGGASVYRQFLPKATVMHVTEVQEHYAGDVKFPEYDVFAWGTAVYYEVVSKTREPMLKFLTFQK